MEYAKLAWVYRFWIVIGVVIVMPIVGYFVDTQSISRNAGTEKARLKNTKEELKKVAQGDTPNEKWVSGVNALKETLSEQVDVAWIDLYKRQSQIMDWPEPVQAAYLKAGPDGDVDQATRVLYQGLYLQQLTDLVGVVDPVGIPRSKELVEMDPGLIFYYGRSWANEGANPPTVREAWLAQEDIWLLRSLLSVIQRANEGSTRFQESAIKRIVDIRMGGQAIDSTMSSKSAPSLAPRSAGSTKVAAGGSSKQQGGDEIPGALFREIPVFMRLVIDQPRLLQVLGEFSRSDIPMQIKQVAFLDVPMSEKQAARMNYHLGGKAKKTGATSTSSSTPQPTAPSKEDEFSHMVQIDVWARAILYKKPPKVEEEEKRQAAAPAAQAAR